MPFDTESRTKLQTLLDEQVKVLPAAFLTVVSPTEILFDGASGEHDPLHPGRQATTDDIMWFASTTKLITSVCYLQLVDSGVLSLDTDITARYQALKAAASKILSFEDGKPVFKENSTPITLLNLMNQSSGFGMEFGETVQAWKKVDGRGFVNSCKAENLIHTPITFEPGTNWEYGNGAEWLALMFPTLAGEEYETYLQENVCKPLGMTGTTFYPFGRHELMPIRFGAGAVPDPAAIGRGVTGEGKVTWEELNGQLDLLTLPRKREEIEYPAGGGGIYSRTRDYALLLQNLLAHYLSLDGRAEAPKHKLLSDKSVASLFKGTLPEAAYPTITQMQNKIRGFSGEHELKEGEADWTTGMALYAPKNNTRFGRQSGSVGWGGAAGTDYWIDPATGIAAVWTTQMLPGGWAPITQAKREAETAVYEVVGTTGGIRV